MVLFLFRHGIAEEAGPGRADRDRALTNEGVERMRRQAAALRRAGVQVDRLFHSPYLRARQTAEALSAGLAVEAEEAALLRPGCSLDDLAELAGRLPDVERLMIVGHQPDLGRMVLQLTGGRAQMRPGALAVVEAARLRPQGGTLLGLYDPDVLSILGSQG